MTVREEKYLGEVQCGVVVDAGAVLDDDKICRLHVNYVHAENRASGASSVTYRAYLC